MTYFMNHILGLQMVKGGEDLGLALKFNKYNDMDGGTEDVDYTGSVYMYIVHSHPSLHKVKVQTVEGIATIETLTYSCLSN